VRTALAQPAPKRCADQFRAGKRHTVAHPRGLSLERVPARSVYVTPIAGLPTGRPGWRTGPACSTPVR
jgi:hypothetical protein